MKRLYVALTLIALSVLICIFSSIKIEENSGLMYKELKDIGEIITSGNNEKALLALEHTETIWNKTESLFSFIIDADKIEEMNVGFAMISAHLKDNNTEHALERLRECEFMLEEISDDEKLDIKNIM